jgi:cholesterol oxidase
MSTTEREGVVDDVGRVHGVPGLRVCDGSVFPGPVGANPSLTIAAFADRLADDLIAEVRG